MLAVMYGCGRFHNCVFGHKFSVQSDHKPLAAIHLKHLNAAPPRLHQMLMRLQQYNMKIVYVPGKYVPVADALLRLSQEDQYDIDDLSIVIHDVSSQFSSEIMTCIRTALNEDYEFQALEEVVFQGWPQSRTDVHQSLLSYWNFHDEISIDDGILLKGSRVIIPKEPSVITDVLSNPK